MTELISAISRVYFLYIVFYIVFLERTFVNLYLRLTLQLTLHWNAGTRLSLLDEVMTYHTENVQEGIIRYRAHAQITSELISPMLLERGRKYSLVLRIVEKNKVLLTWYMATVYLGYILERRRKKEAFMYILFTLFTDLGKPSVGIGATPSSSVNMDGSQSTGGVSDAEGLEDWTVLGSD